MLTKQKKLHFHILDYFLDGQFLRWEEFQGNVPECGQYWVVNVDDTQVVTKVQEVQPVSETESKILLCSCP